MKFLPVLVSFAAGAALTAGLGQLRETQAIASPPEISQAHHPEQVPAVIQPLPAAAEVPRECSDDPQPVLRREPVPLPPDTIAVEEHVRIVDAHERIEDELRQKIHDLDSQLRLVGTLPLAAFLAQQGVSLPGNEDRLDATAIHQFIGNSQLWVESANYFEAANLYDPMLLWKAATAERLWADNLRDIRNRPNLDQSIDKEQWRQHEWPRIWSEQEQQLRDEMAKIGFAPHLVERYLETWR